MPPQVPDRELAGMADLGVAPVEQTAELAQRRDAVSDLGAALRALIESAVASEVPVEVLHEVTAEAGRLRALLSEARREAGRPSSVDDLRRGQRFFNPVVGPGNPIAPPMRIELTGDGASGRVTLGLPYEGPFTFAHGGISALLLDQIMGYATAAAGHPAVTGRLEVRYRGAVPLGRALLVRGVVDDVLGVRVAVRGSISLADEPDTVLVEAKGRFLTLRPEQAHRLFGPPNARRTGAGPASAEPS